MNSIGDHFMCWLSGQSGRRASMAKAQAVVSQIGGRFADDGFNARRVLSNLHRAGHLEKTKGVKRQLVASNPVLIINGSATESHSAEWIGARDRKTIIELLERFNLAIQFSETREDYSRTFLLGHADQLNDAAASVGGSVEVNPGLRLLKMFAPLSRDSFVRENAPIPYDQPLQRRVFSAKGGSWRRVDFAPHLESGLFRINERPIRWLWHEKGAWYTLNSTERLWAGWFYCQMNGRLSLELDDATGQAKVEHLGFPLPILVDRALRLIAGPPTWTRRHIVYNGINATVAAQLVRVMRFKLCKQ